MKFKTQFLLALLAALLLQPAHAQDRRSPIDITGYKISLKPILASQAIEAVAEVTFVPLDNRTMTAVFEKSIMTTSGTS